MAGRKQDAVSSVIAEVEEIARRIQKDVRKAAHATGLDKRLRSAARQLRKRAVRAAEQVEKYAHQAQLELSGSLAKKGKRSSRTRRAA